MTNPKSFGVIGLGSVGWAVVHGLSRFYPYSVYDIAGEYSWDNVLSTDIIFICVSTPSNECGRLDCSAVKNVLERLNSDRYSGCIVVKSTLSIGFMDKMVSLYPALRLLYMPEFIREVSSYTWFTDPDRLVISGNEEEIGEVLSYFSWVDSSITVLKMSYISAEIGKLAHNAYIATKISFTNEIESICSEYNAEALDVMKTIWADRRVSSREHLMPYLGPYMGKCVPKDTRELLNSGEKRALLKAVEAVNASVTTKKAADPEPAIVTIIPTNNRPHCLDRALSSVSTQKKLPDVVYVIIDTEDPSYSSVEKIVEKYQESLSISLIKSSRTQNLSGAINTGIAEACNNYLDKNNVFVSFLDDDDWWDSSYLLNAAKFAQETGADWIISGLIRHNAMNDFGSMQSIPANVTQQMFYISNPNIQGSNLFVRLSNLNDIGGFDENLVSTTDRDICIRLLDSRTIPAILFNHLVHHDADDSRNRLSSAGSEKKSQGLNYFYRKYAHKMSMSEKEAFKKRSEELFQVSVKDEND